MATKAQQLSIERFGKTIRMYEPLYLSNYCHNHCVYCGFNQENDIVRKVLTMEEVQAEAKAIADMGFTHIPVSYTHLDVYKRQLQQRWVDKAYY